MSDFDHDRTDFPLRGGHAGLECEACHTDTWAGLPHASCLDCHADDDPHQGLLAADSCTGCHQVAAWADISFEHAVRTVFALGVAMRFVAEHAGELAPQLLAQPSHILAQPLHLALELTLLIPAPG